MFNLLVKELNKLKIGYKKTSEVEVKLKSAKSYM